MTLPNRASIHDQLRPHLNAADLLQRLGLTVARTLGSEAYCAPLCHESTSGESLQVNLHTGRWNCKACQSHGVYGDLFQLVEYVLTRGAPPSRGTGQASSESSRAALAWLCEQFGVAFDESRVTGDGGLDVVHLVSMAAHQHLLGSPKVLDWIAERWGFDRATVEAYGIGYLPSPMLPELVVEAGRSQSRAAFRASGLGWHSSDGEWKTRFEGRVLFPYLEHGRAVYLIGRATPWTPPLDGGAKPPKYHKLSVHSEQRPYISARVTNDHLYLEPVMSSTDTIVVAEGIADAVALSALGVPVVSPVTISFNATDLERFTTKAKTFGIRRVEILFDNELSGSGNFAARRVGLKLVERGLVARVLTLPLGPEQQRARDEVLEILGEELFAELERSDPAERKEIILRAVPDAGRREWIKRQVEASKIDAAEWSARAGAGAAGRFDEIRKQGRDVIDLEIDDVVAELDGDSDAPDRADAFGDVVRLVAHIEDAIAREAYAGKIAKAAGRGVTKAEISRRVADYRRRAVKPARAEEEEARPDPVQVARELVLLPPEDLHSRPAPPASPGAPPAGPKGPAAPPPPGGLAKSDHDRYAPARDAVAKAVDAHVSEETVGEYVSQTITKSMGFTPFRTAEEVYLVRGSQRVEVARGRGARFEPLLYLASGLTPAKSSHRAYIAAVCYFLERAARKAEDVSWSFVDPVSRAVFFPLGDATGRMLKIEPGAVSRVKMADVRVPAVAGEEFDPIEYVEGSGGIARVLDVFRWTSISSDDRMVLVYWIVCLPILRRIGTVPIVRIEGGSSSGKTRAVNAVSYLVNGRKRSSVPTAPALLSRLSREMLTIDDNRESADVSPAFLGTLLQATQLGAREKRRANTDTGTIVERVCGALLMNGVEPIHDGRPELASRMLTLRCHEDYRSSDSPSSEEGLIAAILGARDGFWSEAAARCAAALELDVEHGQRLGEEIERLFGSTRIGRLSAYLRMVYLAWVAGLEDPRPALATIAPEWCRAFRSIAGEALESLLAEEFAVTVVRYVFAYGDAIAEPVHTGSSEFRSLDGKFVVDREKGGEAFLGPLRATQLARFARQAGRELNAPRVVASDLRAGQLERRLLDGLAYLEAAGFEVDLETTAGGRHRWTFRRPGAGSVGGGEESTPPPAPASSGGDTWVAP